MPNHLSFPFHEDKTKANGDSLVSQKLLVLETQINGKLCKEPNILFLHIKVTNRGVTVVATEMVAQKNTKENKLLVSWTTPLQSKAFVVKLR